MALKRNIFENYYSGTSGLLLPVRNKLFYPEAYRDKSRLCFYGSLMNSLEVNSSFYKVPKAATVAKWANEVPEDFRFTFKLHRGISHNKYLAFDPEAVKHFMEVIDQAGDKKGCLLVQFPPSVRISELRQMALLMDVLRTADPENKWNIALEFRHLSLYREEVYRLLHEHGMGMVLQDKPPAVTPMLETSLSFIYLRFHGPDGNYGGSYEDEILDEYAGYIRNWLREGKTVFSYFNNTMGNAIANLFTLKDMVLS
ncbi:DUF72 domain-containing protein [Pedobacter africanus]|uniref:Uncharacterized conserved protein YecE, DUF72 family n=1 Tax=Pedobacter africanus TaxID=151894 RepID=A0A1W2DC05_9SPHI|nr:DUF72 domain-containing protein [Pedobacter africanus]SMC94538.1 Uncharacterized conserved protein YecE, DUF72 family [Pedobacter africanus]